MKNLFINPHYKIAMIAILSMFMFQSCVDAENDDYFEGQTTLSSTAITGAEPCKELCLVSGQNKIVGTVEVAPVPNGDIHVTYKINTVDYPNLTINQIHLDIFKDLDSFTKAGKTSSGGAIMGQFEYKYIFSTIAKIRGKNVVVNSNVREFTVVIEAKYIESLGITDDCYKIVAHAALSDNNTAYGAPCADPKGKNGSLVTNPDYQFKGSNWSVFFDFCLGECNSLIDFTYAWEDISPALGQSDADYNDLVIQNTVVRSSNELKLIFYATARGACFDHAFRIKVPMAGITGIGGDDGVTNDGVFYYITVFNSTKGVLPGSNGCFANTLVGSTCEFSDPVTITLNTNNSFVYDAAKPYEPFISVFENREINDVSAYDLYVYQISGEGSGTFSLNGEVYPNGIVIPRDWMWPSEQIFIRNAYPLFPNLGNLLANPTFAWWNALENANLLYDQSGCPK